MYWIVRTGAYKQHLWIDSISGTINQEALDSNSWHRQFTEIYLQSSGKKGYKSYKWGNDSSAMDMLKRQKNLGTDNVIYLK